VMSYTSTVAALPSQNVEHVSTVTLVIMILTGQYSTSLTERCGCCITRIKSLRSLPIFPNGASSHVCGVKRQHPTGVRGTYDRVIYLANSEMCVVVLLVRVSLFHLTRRIVGTGAPCRGTRTSKTERVEQKERITWSRQGRRGPGVCNKSLHMDTIIQEN
jgi:hypothetical protein